MVSCEIKVPLLVAVKFISVNHEIGRLIRYAHTLYSAIEWVPLREHSVFPPVFRDQFIRYICAGRVPLRDQAVEWVLFRDHSVILTVFWDQFIRYICAGKVPLRDQAAGKKFDPVSGSSSSIKILFIYENKNLSHATLRHTLNEKKYFLSSSV